MASNVSNSLTLDLTGGTATNTTLINPSIKATDGTTVYSFDGTDLVVGDLGPTGPAHIKLECVNLTYDFDDTGNLNVPPSFAILLDGQKQFDKLGLYDLNGLQVVSARQAAVADAAGTLGQATTAINGVLAALRAHGLIAP